MTHGGMSRRAFIKSAERFAVGGLSAATLFEMLRPNYAWAIQVPPDDPRIHAAIETVPSTARCTPPRRKDRSGK